MKVSIYQKTDFYSLIHPFPHCIGQSVKRGKCLYLEIFNTFFVGNLLLDFPFYKNCQPICKKGNSLWFNILNFFFCLVGGSLFWSCSAMINIYLKTYLHGLILPFTETVIQSLKGRMVSVLWFWIIFSKKRLLIFHKII